MKRFIYTIMIFFALAITLMLGQNDIQTQSITPIGSIQGVKNESVELISNNGIHEEITSSQQRDEQNLSGSTPFATNSQTINHLLTENNTQSYGYTIHNISTDKQKTHQIRAP